MLSRRSVHVLRRKRDRRSVSTHTAGMHSTHPNERPGLPIHDQHLLGGARRVTARPRCDPAQNLQWVACVDRSQGEWECETGVELVPQGKRMTAESIRERSERGGGVYGLSGERMKGINRHPEV